MDKWNELLQTENGRIMKPFLQNENYGILNMLNTEIFAIVPLKEKAKYTNEIEIEGKTWNENAVFFNSRSECMRKWEQLNESESEKELFQNLINNQ